jgi:hypothetical protein
MISIKPLLTMNTVLDFNTRLSDQIISEALTSSTTGLMFDPVPIHQSKIVNELRKSQTTVEPRPIHPKQVSVSSFNSPCLPDSIKNYCEDYIALLGGLAPTPALNAALSAPSLMKKTTAAPTKKTLKIQRHDSSRSIVSDASGASSVGYHAFQNERWMDRFQELVEFYQKEGHFNVPYKSNTTLFQWVKRQRHQFKLRSMGEHSNLTIERIQQLDKIGFVWNSHLAAWNDKFQELKEFKLIHGHCFVPCSYKGSSKLSTWIKRQRRQYRKFMAGQSSTLDAARIDKLENLGLVWDYYAGKDKDGVTSDSE